MRPQFIVPEAGRILEVVGQSLGLLCVRVWVGLRGRQDHLQEGRRVS